MTTLLVLTALAAPVFAAVVGALAGWRWISASLAVVAAGVVLAVAVALEITSHGRVESIASGLLRVDALTVTMLLVIGAIGLLATIAGIGYIGAELAHGHTDPRTARGYAALVPAFLAAMVLAVCAGNLGVVWIAVEATTIATAFLVGHRGTREALEATWKYVMICSVGIVVAFLGTVLLYFAARHAGIGSGQALNLDVLRGWAPRLDPGVTRLAGGLLLLGYCAKAGLVPFHTWLADAHSQAPAPVSALMSGVLLAVALSVVLRLEPIVDAGGNSSMRIGLLILGLLTVAVAALLLTVTRDIKRLLAYSSMENMGLLAIAASVGSRVAIMALLLHLMAHGFGKTVLFVSTGPLQSAHGSTAIAAIRGVAARSRLLGTTFGAGIAVLLGLPPFAIFASELAIARSLAEARLAWVLGVSAMLSVIAFAGLIRGAGRVLLGVPIEDAPRLTVPATTGVALVIGVLASLVLGVTAGPLAGLFSTAAGQVTL